MTDYEKARDENGYLNRYVSRDRAEYRRRMTDQEYRNKIALRALDYIRASSRILTEEIEKGFSVSEAVLDDLCELHDFAVSIAEDPELKEIFARGFKHD